MIDFPQAFFNKAELMAVVGATTTTTKWGYRVLKHLSLRDFSVVGVNPKYSLIGSIPCYPTLTQVPGKVKVVVTIVPPQVTEKVVEECVKLGITHIWMQPGSESEQAVQMALDHRLTVVFEACIVRDGLRENFLV